MAYNFNGSNRYLHGTHVLINEPMTMAAWFRSASTTTDGTILCIGAPTNTTGAFFRISARGDVANDPVQVTKYNGTTAQDTNSTAGFSSNTWAHACGVFSADDSRAVYLNGGSSATGTTSVSDTGQSFDHTAIGALKRETPVTYFNGDIAEAAIWNVALTAAEVSSLSKGFSPSLIRPQSLVFYAPLVRGLIDLKGLALTAVNSPTVSAHTRVYGL